jgi:hypothetical protein
VLEYAQRLKDLADGLADLDQPVSVPTLLLALLHGVNELLRNMDSILKMKDSLPTFLQAQSLLALEESELPVAQSLLGPPPRPPTCTCPRLQRPRFPRPPAHLLALGVTGRAEARALTTTTPGVVQGRGTIRGAAPSICGLSLARAF